MSGTHKRRYSSQLNLVANVCVSSASLSQRLRTYSICFCLPGMETWNVLHIVSLDKDSERVSVTVSLDELETHSGSVSVCFCLYPYRTEAQNMNLLHSPDGRLRTALYLLMSHHYRPETQTQECLLKPYIYPFIND